MPGITPSFKDKNPLKNNSKNPNNSNDRFGLNVVDYKEFKHAPNGKYSLDLI